MNRSNRPAGTGSAPEGFCGAPATNVAVYSAVVPSSGEVEIDVRNASTLTLRTATVEPTYWRLGGGLSYGGGLPPALATDPVKASFCDGAAWADAALV